MKRFYFLLAFCLAFLLASIGLALAQEPMVEGLVTIQSPTGVEDTINQLQTTIQDRGLTLLATVDHAGNAQGVGQELRPTQLLIFGNPNLGTQLMQSQQSVGIDLPQKFLVWQDEAGQVNISYNEPQYLMSRHSLEGTDEVLTTITNALGGLSSGVTGPEVMADDSSAAMESEDKTAMLAEDDSPTTTEAPPQALPTSGANTSLMPWWLIGGGVVLLALAWRIRRRALSKLLIFIAIPLLMGAMLQSGVVAQESNGLVTIDSPYSVDETVNRLQTTMEERGLTVMTTIDHAANADNVGLELRPTQLIIFGNPNLGTQLMQSSQSIAIDLPQKFLVWDDADGQVRMTYNDPQYLAQRHSITDRDDVLTTISNALNGLAEAASSP